MDKPKSEPLIFPRGVRFPRRKELPRDSQEILERISTASITTGYNLTQVENNIFSTYIEANVHAPDIFEVFRKLSFALLPDVVAPLIGLKDEEPVFGPYTDRSFAVGIFEPYVDLLQNDGFLEFGIIHQSDLVFEEIFVTSSKYFKIWTNNGEAAEEVFRFAGIPKCEKLNFIDEYPMVSLSIGNDENAAWPNPFYSIQDEFSKLPQPLIVEHDDK